MNAFLFTAGKATKMSTAVLSAAKVVENDVELTVNIISDCSFEFQSRLMPVVEPSTRKGKSDGSLILEEMSYSAKV